MEIPNSDFSGYGITWHFELLRVGKQGRFEQELTELRRIYTKRPCFLPSIHKKQQCHPERSEGSHRSIYQLVNGCCR